MSATTKTPITKEQWQAISEELKGTNPYVCFQYQSRKVEVIRVRVSESKFNLRVFVDGKINTDWLHPENENHDPISTAVWCNKKVAIYTPSEIKRIEKVWGKREAKKVHPNLHKKLDWNCPDFGASRTLIGQYKKLKGLTLEIIGHKDRLIHHHGVTLDVSNTHA